MDDGGSPVVGLAVFLVLVLFSGLVSAIRVILRREDEDKFRALGDVFKTFIHLAAGAFCLHSFIKYISRNVSGLSEDSITKILIYVGLFTVMFFVFAVADMLGERIAKAKMMQPAQVEDEIISMVNEGHEQGVIEADEAEMITNIFEFGDTDARDIMTHRKNIAFLEADMTLKEALLFMLDGNNSRFPVCNEDLDDVLGVVHIKDVVTLLNTQSEKANLKIREVKGLIRNVEVIPETRKINVLFQNMQMQKNHMVIVMDEYGQTSGLVTMEDILEEIVGNIMDEYDEDEVTIVQESEGGYLVQGVTELEEIQQELDITFDLDAYDTLNGFLIAQIDQIPEDGEHYEVTYEGYLFQAISVENKLIQTVRITKLPENKQEDEEEKR